MDKYAKFFIEVYRGLLKKQLKILRNSLSHNVMELINKVLDPDWHQKSMVILLTKQQTDTDTHITSFIVVSKFKSND